MGVTLKVQRKKHTKVQPNLSGPSRVKVGFPAGTGNVDKAIWNEFGTKGSGKGFKTARGGGFGGPIPERPFMRNSIKGNKAKYTRFLKSMAAKILTGQVSMGQAMAMLGNLGVADIQKEIDALKSPPNSPTTIRLKGSDNPLIDTGAMRQSVTYKVDG